MRFYELTYLLPSGFAEDKTKEILNRIVAFLKEGEGILEGDPYRNRVIRRRLASLVHKEKEASLNFINFYFRPQEIEGLKTKLNSEKGILRYIILNKREPKKGIRAPRVLPKTLKRERETKDGLEKVDLREIEKKLEEILDQ